MKDFLNLRTALLCSECESVFIGTSYCPACGSDAILGLWRFVPSCQSSATLKLNADPIPQDVIELERIVGYK